MIILDTNVISERLRPDPDEMVLRWFKRTLRSEARLTIITVAELRGGAARLPQGRRRAELEQVVEDLVNDSFRDRIETFDLPASRAYAGVVEASRRAGRPTSMADAMIAAICLARAVPLATRNIKDFEETGVTLINPWEG